MMNPLESTLTGWQNPAPGKCLCLRLPLTLLMTSLDRTCNSTEATFRAKFLSSIHNNAKAPLASNFKS